MGEKTSVSQIHFLSCEREKKNWKQNETKWFEWIHLCVLADLDLGCWFGWDELIAASFIEIVQHTVLAGAGSCPHEPEWCWLFASCLKHFHITCSTKMTVHLNT